MSFFAFFFFLKKNIDFEQHIRKKDDRINRI